MGKPNSQSSNAPMAPSLTRRLQLAGKMVHEIEAKQPGLKALLKNRGIGDSALVVSQLIQQAERWHVRQGRS